MWQTSPVGPFDAWPTGGGGFEYFYGFIGGEANQWYPTLYEGTTPVEPEKTPEEGYHLVEDMTDKAIAWIGQQKALAPDKPFFVYFAPGATHAPHHVPKEWADKYKGKFDQGWDKLREETFARQKKLGVIPQDCQLTARHKEIPAWDDMPEAFKPVLRREMEVYAGFMEYTDHHVGRLFDGAEEARTSSTTRSSTTSSATTAPRPRARINGCFNEMSYFNGLQAFETPEYLHGAARQARRAGVLQPLRRGLGARHEHALPVDQAGRLALGRHAQRHHRPLAEGDQGQGRDPLAVQPRHRRGADDPRGGGHSRAGLGGRHPAGPDRGRRACSTRFNDAKAAERHETQYFEMFGNRGIYHKGWTAVTKHCTPWMLWRRSAGARRRRLGALRHHQGLEPGERPVQGECRRSSTSCSGSG